MSPTSRRRGICAALALAILTTGTGAPAVVGGREDDGPLARSTVMVLKSGGGICSAVVLSADVVLTAAHCASGASQFRVHYKRPDGTPVLLEPVSIALHPGYVRGAEKSRQRSIDLALLRVSQPLPASFSPAALAASAPTTGSALTLGGYGLSREKVAGTSGTFRTVSLVKVEPFGPGTILLWAEAPDRSVSGACEGDSGGPIGDSVATVVAITSWATGSAGRTCGALSQGALVGPQRTWIDRTLSGWGRSAVWR